MKDEERDRGAERKSIALGSSPGRMIRSARARELRARFLFILHPSAFILILTGCSGYAGPRSVMNDDPAVKIPEIHKAVERGDRSVLPHLVKDLDSDDAAVRLHAIGALRKLTGEHFDYQWTEADRLKRRPAIDRWQAYLDSSDSRK